RPARGRDHGGHGNDVRERHAQVARGRHHHRGSPARHARGLEAPLPMPFYKYKAVSGAGEVQEGVLEASSSSAAVARVQSMGLIPIRAEEAGAGGAAAPAASARRPFFQKNKVTQNDIGIATRELATLLRAGLPLDRSFEILINL